MEMKDTPMEVNKNDDVLEMPIKHNSTSKDQVKTSTFSNINNFGLLIRLYHLT